MNARTRVLAATAALGLIAALTSSLGAHSSGSAVGAVADSQASSSTSVSPDHFIRLRGGE